MTDGGVPRSARLFVAVLGALLAVPGLIGFDAWPLTGWRLFSADRGPVQDRWEIVAVDASGATEPFDLDRLSIAYRNAEWILDDLPSAPEPRREEVCRALLGGVEDARPATAGLLVVRNHRRMVERDGEFVVEEDRQALHECGVRAA